VRTILPRVTDNEAGLPQTAVDGSTPFPIDADTSLPGMPGAARDPDRNETRLDDSAALGYRPTAEAAPGVSFL
jgi:hypothetical protein